MILEAAGAQLAKNGPEGLSVSQVAQRAGVNRGTAYQHFQTREQLMEATTAWVGEKLMREVFYDPSLGTRLEIDQVDPEFLVTHLAEFVMANPELGKVWLFEILASGRSATDPFWNLFKSNCDKFVQSDMAQPGIDSEVNAVTMLVGAFLWPVWARAQVRTAAERRQLVKRYTTELLRLSLYGTMRPEKFAAAPAAGSRRKAVKRQEAALTL
ncbi:MAG TPA: helix-turn-helix domain-containing protein [Nevskia sp.]|nr:helix-turn-helix domain-containing protein [Nevskia sp.]